MEQGKHFDGWKVTNGHRKGDADSAAKKIGCTGKLGMESETISIVKKCEGVEKKIATRVKSAKVTFSGHVPVDVLRDIFGVDTKGLKSGVYAYGENSIGKGATYTWEIIDPLEEEKKYIAFPRLTVASGLKWEIENGNDTIAEIELEFEAEMDAGKKFYYEAYESDIKTDADLKSKWHKQFSYDIVKANSI